jgi:hypothetical protein
MRKKDRIRIFKPSGRGISQNAVEAGCTEVRREGHVSTSRPSKRHVVDRPPFAEPPEGHAPTALCEITLRSYRTTNASIQNRVMLNYTPRHPEQYTPTSCTTHQVILNLFQDPGLRLY